MSNQAPETKEPQYQHCFDLVRDRPATSLGLMTNQVWHDDPKRLAFVLSRYKFVAKIISGVETALEVGCADAWDSPSVQQETGAMMVGDCAPVYFDDVESRMDDS